MTGSEGVGRLIASIAVAAAVGAQSFVTRNVVAEEIPQANDFGVRLLATQLSAPVSPTDANPLSFAPLAVEPSVSAAAFVAPPAEPRTRDPMRVRARHGFGIALSELRLSDIRADRSLDRRLPTRDSAGSLIEISENDVLIPLGLDY